ncbi:MAG: YihY family inner membrane protein [Gammaproteobacteria bacterium]|nr:YihY family inner membrane protein [Gammaproteobacteria bacterium]
MIIFSSVNTLYRYIDRMIWKFVNDACFTRAAALAYTTLLALVPLMTVSLALLSAFPVFQDGAQKIQDFVFSNFVAGSADIIQQHLQSFVDSARHLSPTGLFFLVVTAIMMIFNMESDLNAIWRVKQRRHGVSAFLIYWGVLTLLPISVGVGIAVSTNLAALPLVVEMGEFLDIKTMLLRCLPNLITWMSFTILYVTLPNCVVKIRHAIWGGLVAMILFSWAKFGFSWYLINFPSYELLYGALATIPIFLLWLYMTWLIILFGAVVAYVIANGNETEI